MRLFIAIKVSDPMKEALIHTQNSIYDHGIRGNYTREENLHLTLAFIGEYPDPRPVMDALENVSFAPFELELQGMSGFGDLWWAGIKDTASLTAVVGRLRRALDDTGIPFDRKRFSPHITLIRKADGRMPEIEIPKAAMTVSALSLMRSDRGKPEEPFGRKRMIYTEIGTREAESEHPIAWA